jgi:hypothetical protein
LVYTSSNPTLSDFGFGFVAGFLCPFMEGFFFALWGCLMVGFLGFLTARDDGGGGCGLPTDI